MSKYQNTKLILYKKEMDLRLSALTIVIGWFEMVRYKTEMDLRLSPLMIVIGRFEMDMWNLIGSRYGARIDIFSRIN